MRWIDAVKIWNQEHNKGTWCMPRRGSPEHARVKAIMEGKKEKPKKAKVRLAEESEEETATRMGKVAKESKAKKLLSKAIAKYKARKAAPPEPVKKQEPKRFPFPVPSLFDDKPTPLELSEKEEKYLMTNHFKFVSPEDDSLAILDKDDEIRERDVKLFQYLISKKLTEEHLRDLLPFKRNYFYYRPKRHAIVLRSESRL